MAQQKNYEFPIHLLSKYVTNSNRLRTAEMGSYHSEISDGNRTVECCRA